LIPLALLFVGKLRARMLPYGAAALFFAVYALYFTHLVHKELRYALAILPIAMVLAGTGISIALGLVPGKRLAKLLVLFFIISGLFTSIHLARSANRNDAVYDAVGATLDGYAGRTGMTAHVLSSAPFPVSRSDAKIVDTLYDDWREVAGKYEHEKAGLTHVLIDSCTLETVCRFDSGCTNGKDAALAAISRDMHPAVDGMAGACHVTLYEKNVTFYYH
jgi:hypothetical protein